MSVGVPFSYAGIGSRRAPLDVLTLCAQIGGLLRESGWILRSGHAIGCDQAFEAAGDDPDKACAEIFLPWKDYEADVQPYGAAYPMPSMPALEAARARHPTPDRLSMAALRLLARNHHILFGRNLDEPVTFVCCWFDSAVKRGGTYYTAKLASDSGIPVHNLADSEIRKLWELKLSA